MRRPGAFGFAERILAMPRSGTEPPPDPTPSALREKAEHARRLAWEFAGNERRVMLAFADELEEKARQLEAAAGGL